ncbi:MULTISPECIES: DUF3274 domain-containing protein [Paraburkholderia]|uniref:T6SS effector phospholipase Tle3 domain-containing protein n=1 Tax=Paraburkholderia TaxID=1822464 RepID=UPI0022533CAE|nr:MULTISPECIES: DUF3274 domain-containing protein [Paraburkholderia]MCX4165874.1 DUF3274 domain-containing protein [Paraburkholderia megapolitana]MDN7161365.1 DUF3274 domain-containing protein [Paraburkholderia sp. CHISQ3]MDQ6498412.1 DUF3274 domain-containing protein [Paraburkholderia megapolitana]
MSDTDSGRKPIAHHTGTTVPNRDSKAHRHVPLPQRLPCTTILIHGVNDLGVDFGTVEGGLCEGLNDRLGRKDLKGGTYTHGRTPNDPTNVKTSDLMKHLDDVIYRRQESEGTKSPLIPFYWGFKASTADMAKKARKQIKNGQYVDKFGNRLDSHRAKNGGMFANATTNIPAMFDSHFEGGLKTAFLNWKNDDLTHPLYEAPNRHYMVLAAMRLAALVRQIRIIDKDGTVNIIAHSQGTIISLLAQAFLVDGLNPQNRGAFDRPADTLILIDSPYSFAESSMDQTLQTGNQQQTIWARVKTLANLTGVVASAKYGTPPPQKLKHQKGNDNYGVTGPKWDPDHATRLTGPEGNTSVVFAERDNRGKVYVYFCPEDQTVGLRGVNGMGSIGLPNSINAAPAQEGAKPSAIGLVSDTFRQRIFTRRLRHGKPVQVGTPPGPYNMREHGETSHGASGTSALAKQAQIAENTMRNINGEALTPPFNPDLEENRLPDAGGKPQPLDGKSPNEFEGTKQSIDQVDAETALSASDLQQVTPYRMRWPGLNIGDLPTAKEVEQVLNSEKGPDDQCKVDAIANAYDGGDENLRLVRDTIVVLRTETPNEAKVRLMNNYTVDDSYHSAVMSGRLNHRCATAFDVSIGQARALDDPHWQALLRAIADWRIPIQQVKDASPNYPSLEGMTQRIVEANCAYYDVGKFPSDLVPATPPAPVVSETIQARDTLAVKQMRADPSFDQPAL